jgi:hypothetical protein
MQVAAVSAAVGLAGTAIAADMSGNRARPNSNTAMPADSGMYGTSARAGIMPPDTAVPVTETVTGYMIDSAPRGSAEQTNSMVLPGVSDQDFVNGLETRIAVPMRPGAPVEPASSLDTPAAAPNTARPRY